MDVCAAVECPWRGVERCDRYLLPCHCHLSTLPGMHSLQSTKRLMGEPNMVEVRKRQQAWISRPNEQMRLKSRGRLEQYIRPSDTDGASGQD